MALNPFGGFIHRSPLSSAPHDPPLDLASDCIRDFFGPTVQTVSDCLQSRGPSTLPQLVSKIRSQCRRVLNEERERLVDRLPATVNHWDAGCVSRPRLNRATGPEHAGYITDAAPVRAALLVLLQHSLVTADLPGSASNMSGSSSGGSKDRMIHYTYTFLPERARLLPRYPRYVEHARKALGTTAGKKVMGDYAASIVEEVLIHGRMRTEEMVKCVVNITRHRVESAREDDSDGDGDGDENESDNRMGEAELAELRESVVEALKSLIEAGYLEMISPIDELDGEGADEGEREFGNEDGTAAAAAQSSKKRKRSGSIAANRKRAEIEAETPPSAEPDDPNVVALLRTKQNRAFFAAGAVWRVSTHMFHDSLRSFYLGRLIAERYGDRIPSCGSVVSAALKLVARRDHGFDGAARADERFLDERAAFCPDDLMEYLPPPVRASLDAKRGGGALNLSDALLSLAELDWPQSVREVEEAAGHPRHGKFEISVSSIMGYMRRRVMHQMVQDSHGEVAARIISILQTNGSLDAETIAEAAMVPAKDVREILHRLYKTNFISILVLQQSKQYNPSNAYYLWNVDEGRLFQTVTDTVCNAFLNLRLRRQHEMELGKDWVERAKDALADENDHELDRENYNKFCQGLERLDNAMLQLDETLMVLRDF